MRFVAFLVLATACVPATGQYGPVFTPGYGYTTRYAPRYEHRYQGQWRVQAQYGYSHSLIRPSGRPQYGAGDSIVVPNDRLYQFDISNERDYPPMLIIPDLWRHPR